MMLQPPASAVTKMNSHSARKARSRTMPPSGGDPVAGHRRCPQDLVQDLRRADAADARRRVDDEAVRQRRLGERLDVVGDGVVTTTEEGAGLGSTEQRQRAAARSTMYCRNSAATWTCRTSACAARRSSAVATCSSASTGWEYCWRSRTVTSSSRLG